MPSWLTIILALGGSSLISGVVAFVLQRTIYKKAEERDQAQRAKAEQELKDREELEELRMKEERDARLEDIKKILEPISQKIDAISDKLNATAEGTLASLRNDILTLYYKCCEKGYRNDYDYKNIHDMYEAYTELDGNSFVADIMKRFDALPVKENTVPTKVVKRGSKTEKIDDTI